MKMTIYWLTFIMATAYSSMNAMEPSYQDYEKELQLRIEKNKSHLESEWGLDMMDEGVSNYVLDEFNRGYAEQNLTFHQELSKHGYLLLVKKLLVHLKYSDMRPIYESGLEISYMHEQHACAEFFAGKIKH